jgi:steroid 5-alpha reductase family enzyme
MELLTTLVISLGFNLLMFVPAYFYKTDKLTDLSYAISFVALALYGLLYGGLTVPSLLLFISIFIWALRLGTYLFIRISKIKKDTRFDQMRTKFWSFLQFWVLQGISVWIVLIPSTLFFLNKVENISVLSLIGLIIWFMGLSIEAIADIQKYRFINNPINTGKWIDTGLWSYSRHPNYLGEITLWIGIYIFTIFGLNNLQILIGLIGPLYISLLIIFVSGIPILEKSADNKWGNDANYKDYKKKTAVLVPFFKKN